LSWRGLGRCVRGRSGSKASWNGWSEGEKVRERMTGVGVDEVGRRRARSDGREKSESGCCDGGELEGRV
jgi:hypothetical protein